MEKICKQCGFPVSACNCQPDKFGQNRMKHYNNINTINNNFKYHPPKDEQVKMYEQIRKEARQFALLFNELCPDSREKSLAMTKLEESVMWANAAIARND